MAGLSRLFGIAGTLGVIAGAFLQSGDLLAQTVADQSLSIVPHQWAADAARNEVKALQYDRSYLRYRMHLVDAKGDLVRDVIESRDGTVARLMMKDNRPLTKQEDEAEQDRMQAMLKSPAAFAKHIKNDQAGKKLAAEVIQQMPSAMLFSYTPGQPQRTLSALAQDGPEVVLDFKPDPTWTPSGIAAEALTGVQGRLWIDPRSHYVTRLEGTVFRGINIGFGILAHVYPGGTVTFEQSNVSEQRWMFTHFVEHVTLRALIKTINENSDVQSSNFTPVAAMSYQDAIHLLLATPLPGH